MRGSVSVNSPYEALLQPILFNVVTSNHGFYLDKYLLPTAQ